MRRAPRPVGNDAMVMSTGAAEAEDIPGFVNKVTVGSGTFRAAFGTSRQDYRNSALAAAADGRR
ncbi:hypothetical protein [Streptomyces griseofuscus]|uniref:hypothetical protein n=1 Tax=Streptomyces griseofuscus TaxID=146922 RepID=UPI003451AC67